MTEQKSNQNIDFSEAKKPSDLMEREADKQSTSDTVSSDQDFTYEQETENKLAHEQNITAHIPGGSTIADIDR